MTRYLIGDLDLTDWPFATIFGGDQGNPVNVAEVIDSMLQDGEVYSSTRSSNRTMSYPILIEESDLGALATAAARLYAETEKPRNTFTIDPDDGFAEVTVFESFRVQVDYVHEDDWEMAGFRQYRLTIPALPFGRSDTEVVDEALPSGGSVTTNVLSDGSSATNWTGTSTVTASGGTLRQTVNTTAGVNADGPYYSAESDFIYTPGAPVNMSLTPYLSVDVTPPTGGISQGIGVTAFADGVELELKANSMPASGVYRFTFLCLDPSVAVLRIHVGTQNFYAFGGGGPMPTALHQIDNVTGSNQAPNSSSTGRASLRTIKVRGTARTQGSFSVQHETAGIGDVLVYTSPALSGAALGYQPPLRAWRTAGGTEHTDAATVSGKREDLTSGVTFNPPAAGLPKGTFVLMGRLRSTSGSQTVRVTWDSATKIGSTLFGEEIVTSGEIDVTTGAWTIATLGIVTLPSTDVTAASAGTAQISGFAGFANVEYDDLWLFYLGEDAALSHFVCGAGTPAIGTVHNRFRYDTAAAGSDPAVWMGTTADWSDAFHAGELAAPFALHSFAPPTMNVFVVTTGAVNPAVVLRHYPRWHSHAAALD